MEAAVAAPPPPTHTQLLLEFIRDNPQIFVFYALFLLILPLQDVGLPHLYGRIVSQIQKNQAYKQTFLYIVAIIIVIQVINAVLDWEEMTLVPKLTEYIHLRILRSIFEKYSTRLEDVRIGELFAKIMKLPFALYDYFETWRYFIIPQFLVYFLTAAYFYWRVPAIGIAFAATMAIVGAMIIVIPQLCYPISMKRDQYFNQLSEAIDEMVKNMPAIFNAASYPAEEAIIRRFHERYAHYTHASMKCMLYCKLIFIFVYIAFVAYFFWRCYHGIRRGEISAGVFVSLFTIITYTTGSMWRMVYNVKDVIFRIGTIKESITVFDPFPVPASLPGSGAAGAAGAAVLAKDAVLYFDGVSFKYPATAAAETALLDRFYLKIADGERVLLTGKIGSGKSTILRLLMKYYIPDSGEIYYRGRSYASMSPADVRAVVGYVPQTPVLFNRTIYENINYGHRPVSRAEILELIARLDLEETFARFKQGLDTPVGKYGNAISGGQRQLIWILRVVFQKPDVLLLDEPTASIDAETKHAVLRLIEYAATGRTVIAVSHDAYLNRLATRIITMDRGRIVADNASSPQ